MESIASIFENLDEARAAMQRLRSLGVAERRHRPGHARPGNRQVLLDGNHQRVGEGFMAGAFQAPVSALCSAWPWSAARSSCQALAPFWSEARWPPPWQVLAWAWAPAV